MARLSPVGRHQRAAGDNLFGRLGVALTFIMLPWSFSFLVIIPWMGSSFPSMTCRQVLKGARMMNSAGRSVSLPIIAASVLLPW